MYNGWNKFCTEWRDANASPVESEKVTKWLNGDQLEDCKACQTICKRDNDLNRPPYRTYNRYSVSY